MQRDDRTPEASTAATTAAQLASAATSLSELTDRIEGIADQHRADTSNTITPELDEIERALRSAARKLDRLLRRLR